MNMKNILGWIIGDIAQDVTHGILVWGIVIVSVALHGKLFYGDIYLSPAAKVLFVLPVYIGIPVVATAISMVLRGTYSPSRSRFYW